MMQRIWCAIGLGAAALQVAALAAVPYRARPYGQSGPHAIALPSSDVRALDVLDLLSMDTELERQLAPGAEQIYRLAIPAGECVSVLLQQRGMDVAIEVRDADGGVLSDVQDDVRPVGRELVDVCADVQGTYTLEVRRTPGISAAGSYSIRISERHTATQADRSLQESRAARAAAARLEVKGRFEESRPLLERALRIAEGVRGPDDPYVIAVVRDLAGNALELRDTARAEMLYRRALAVLDRTRGAEDPDGASVRLGLAAINQRMGEAARAEAYLQQALATLEKTVGVEHPWYIRGLATLGTLRNAAADLEKAEEIDRHALAVMEKIGQRDTILYADLQENLGDVLRQKQDYSAADALFQRSLEIGERLRGPNSYHVGTTLQNLGIVARERKDYAMAEAYYRTALAIREGLVGPNHPDVAQILNNLANIYRATGDVRRSLETHLRALQIWEATAGPYERGTLLSAGNIAKAYAAAGDIPNAIAFQGRADAILERQLGLNLAAGSERQKLAFARSVAERTDRTISLHLNQASDNADAGALAALVLLQRKGRVLDAMADTFAAVRQRATDAQDRDLLDQLRTTTAGLARAALGSSEWTRFGDRQRGIKELQAQKERLEARLSDRSAEIRAQVQPVTLEAVQAAIPARTALLEFAVFRPFDPAAERNAEAYGPPHYAAYVIRPGVAPRGIDLGPAVRIDDAIDVLRQALRDPSRSDVQPRARDVDELVMRPLRAWLGDVDRLLISPDGGLNLIPFEALVDEEWCYLIQHFVVTYLTSGRDLLRMQVPRAEGGRPVILADPVFGEPAAMAGGKPSVDRASGRGIRRGAAGGGTLSSMYFAPLGATSQEARTIKALFPEALLLTGREATKAMLERVDAPRILHIASHAFFLQSAAREAAPEAMNPMLRSGLALAGANLAGDLQRDGILTALEASGLNLWGTKLVTLSACDTGIGDVRTGEGVFGLRRAFTLAGAETVVTSLWPVSDYVTREAMVSYYVGLRVGLGRADALRKAKLAMLRRAGREHPFYWASFIQSGEWATLDNRR
jgi:CHAT domain-containing protein